MDFEEMSKYTNRRCRERGELLVLGKNWRISDAKNYNYVCRYCDDERRRSELINRKIKNLEVENEELREALNKLVKISMETLSK